MKRTQLISSVAFALSLIACTKTSSNQNEVFIRIENTTSESFSNFQLNSTDFGSIPDGDTTIYRECKNVLPIPFANAITINNSSIYIVDVAPTPFLDNGKYLLQVVADTLPWRYKASFIKE